MGKALVVYYSFSNGNTRKYAERLAGALGADIARVETVEPYPPYGGSDSPVVAQGEREVREGFRPRIVPLGVDVAGYDVVAVGTPTWWFTMAPAMLTFLESQEWEGKTVVPFMTHGGWPGHVLDDIRACCEGARFAEGFEIQFDSQGGSVLNTREADIDAWIDRVRREVQG